VSVSRLFPPSLGVVLATRAAQWRSGGEYQAEGPSGLGGLGIWEGLGPGGTQRGGVGAAGVQIA
jgi:hypothetical protein